MEVSTNLIHFAHLCIQVILLYLKHQSYVKINLGYINKIFLALADPNIWITHFDITIYNPGNRCYVIKGSTVVQPTVKMRYYLNFTVKVRTTFYSHCHKTIDQSQCHKN